jgi:hypothetical protein
MKFQTKCQNFCLDFLIRLKKQQQSDHPVKRQQLKRQKVKAVDSNEIIINDCLI